MPEENTDGSRMNDESPKSLAPRTAHNTALSPSYGPYLQTLPATRTIPRESLAEADASEGVHPTAAERVNADPRKSVYEIFILSFAAVAFVGILTFAFPWKYFLKPSPYEIALGPQTQSISDEDVRKMGGIEKLYPVQLAVHEVSTLRNEGRLHAARDKCSAYIAKIQSDSEHSTWIPIWRHYLEILDRLRQTDSLVAQCSRLKKVIPDSPEASFYPVKLEVDAIPRRASNNKNERRKHAASLESMLRESKVSEATLAERKKDPSAQEMLNGFRLLIADIYRHKWWLSGYSWEDDNRELAFQYLRKLPSDSLQATEMKLSLLRDCNEYWFGFWRNDPSTRTIDAHSMTPANLREEIQRLEGR
jgi:hypothetical protein